MTTYYPHVFIVVAALASGSAQADWTDPGAVYLCDQKAKAFTIQSTMDTSSPEDSGTVVSRPGYKHIEGSISCRIEGAQIETTVEVYPPRPTGMCGGITHTLIRSLVVNGKKVFDHPTSFNTPCTLEPVLYEIRITAPNGSPIVKACYATWDWGVGYKETKCDDIQPR
jgi:hypothetical protein